MSTGAVAVGVIVAWLVGLALWVYALHRAAERRDKGAQSEQR